MEKIIKKFIYIRFVPNNIYLSINVKKRYLILQTIFISLLIAVPLSFGVFSFNTKYIIENLFPEITSIDNLQNELLNNSNYIKDTGSEVIIKTDDYELVDFNSLKRYIVLRDTYVNININGYNFYGGYFDSFENIMHNYYHDTLILINTLIKGVTLNILSLLSILIYPLTLILNIIYISIITLIAMMLNIGSDKSLNYKQLFSLLVYSGTIPALLAFILGLYLSVAFVYVIFNFGVIIFGYYIYLNGQKQV